MDMDSQHFDNVDDIKELKQRRTVQKGAITKLSKALDILKDCSFEDLDEGELLRNQRLIEDSICACEALQERIESLQESTFTIGEADSEEEQSATHATLRKVVSKLVAAYQSWRDAESMITQISRLERIKKFDTEVALEKFRKFSENYGHLERYSRQIKDQCFKDTWDRLKEKYLELQDRVMDDNLEVKTCSPVGKVTVKVSGHRKRKIKELPLPTYRGDIAEWRAFWRQFNEVIDDGFSDDERLSYLLDCLKDSTARAIVQESISNGDDYNYVVTRLQRQMDRPRDVYQSALKSVMGIGQVDYDKNGLTTLTTDVLHAVNTLKHYGDGSMTQMMTAMMELRMSPKLRQEWSLYHGKPDCIQPFDDLLKFAEQRQRILLAPSQSRDVKTHTNKPFSKPSPGKSPGAIVMRTRGMDVSCPACEDNHLLFQCGMFKGWDLEGKNDLVKRKRLCFNCLAHGHLLNSCSSRKTCRECGERHHTLLYKPIKTSAKPADSPAAPSTSGSSAVMRLNGVQSATSTVFETAIAKVSTGHAVRTARLLFDSGANISLITNRLAITLKAKRIQSYKEISGFGGNRVSNLAVEIELGSAYKIRGRHVRVRCQVVDDIYPDWPGQDLSKIAGMSFLKNKQLADPGLGEKGKIDILLGLSDVTSCYLSSLICAPECFVEARESIFGWVVRGAQPENTSSNVVLKISSTDARADELLQRLWKQEDVLDQVLPYTEDEVYALDHFKNNTMREPDGRYSVSLPKRIPTPRLGDSRQLALKRYYSNERSLKKKGTWEQFQSVVREYADLDHAELVPRDELQRPAGTVYYLPMHDVVKDSSTTTKLGVVFDASAKTNTGFALNDLLLPGPSLYPSLPTVLNKFRRHRIGMSADISKMFREVVLNREERDLHRFFMRSESGDLEEWRMKRLTFGVTSSPFLATQVLRQVAEDYQQDFLIAAESIRTEFYVDDVLTGANTIDEAKIIREELNSLLFKAGMKLRKWRSSSSDLIESIPEVLQEKAVSPITSSSSHGTKALGVYWNTQTDMLHVSTPELKPQYVPTKREITSVLARVFDVLGWFAPAIVFVKILLQKLWESKLGWDDPIPDHLKVIWERWTGELSSITEKPIPRKLFAISSEVVDIQLHGFSDASMAAYGGVIYLRARYTDASVTVTIVSAKTRVAPLKKQTIPKLELCGALLTARLLSSVAADLNVPTAKLYAWSDSAIVLSWLVSTPSRLKVYVAHRVREIVSKVPGSQWRYVSTDVNPADFASRGLLPQELVGKDLWWDGPPWLRLSPSQWPHRSDLAVAKDLPELRGRVMLLHSSQFDLWDRYSIFSRLLRIVAWCLRFYKKLKKITGDYSDRLTASELQSSRTRLLSLVQAQYYPQELNLLNKGKNVPSNSCIVALQPLLGEDGLLRVGGRLQQFGESDCSVHPIILSQKSPVVKLLVEQLHRDSHHAGPSTLLAILSETYHIPGVKRLVKKISRVCVLCQKAYAKTVQQQMGQLPAHRVTPSPPFQTVGIDLAGPFLCHRGNPRRPTRIKTYVCIYVCFSTRAVHLELLTDMSAQAFLASFS